MNSATKDAAGGREPKDKHAIDGVDAELGNEHEAGRCEPKDEHAMNAFDAELGDGEEPEDVKTCHKWKLQWTGR